MEHTIRRGLGDTGRLSRRALLQGAAAATASGLLLAEAKGAMATDAPATDAPGPSTGVVPSAEGGGIQLFSDSSLNFQVLYALGSAAYGSSEIGDVSVAVDATNAAGPGAATFHDAFLALADRMGTDARAALDAGHPVTARRRFLRAAEYGAQALFFVLASSRPASEPEVFTSMRANWEAAAKLFDPPIQRVRIPYEGSTMPAYFMRPDRSGRRRPTVIVNNGSDGQTVEVYPFGPAAAVERGWNALILEGPGQGAMFFERGVLFRPDWEKVITPVVDYLVKRPDVDRDRIALTGWSMAGELVARAAAFEHRLAAVVTDPGGVDSFKAWGPIYDLAQSGDATTINTTWNQEVVPALSPEDVFNLKKRAEIFSTEAWEQARAGQMFTDLAAVTAAAGALKIDDATIAEITSPTLVIDYEFEEFYPGQADELYEKLTTKTKDLVRLTSANGAQYHCAPMAPQWRNEIVFDWLEDTLGI